jgi:MoxR-like ATPase
MDELKIGKQTLEFLELCYRSKKSVLLVGGHGVGKSEHVKQAASELGIGFHCSDLSLMEPPDLVGLPKMAGGVTVFAPPATLPSSGEGIWMLEELNRCERHMLAPCLQLLTERRLNDYVLPEGWLPMAAVNSAEDGYDVNELDDALLSRFVVLRVEPDQAEWLAWARREDLHPQVIDYVASDESIFKHPQSNPRSWAHVSDILKAAEENETSELVLRAAVSGKVGMDRMSAFMASRDAKGAPLTAEDVIEAYPQHSEKLQAQISGGHLDEVESTLHDVLRYLQPAHQFEQVQDDSQNWKHLRAFMYDLPGDLRQRARDCFKDWGYRFPARERRLKYRA